MSIDDMVADNVEWLRQRARRYYENEFDADDLASDTMCKCLSQRNRFKDGMAFKPWACAIMQNTFINQYNRRKCVLIRCSDTVDKLTYDTADQLLSVRTIMAVIDSCASKSVNIECVMLYAHGYTHAEIAERIGIPIGTVKSRVSLGRKMLHKALGA